MGATFTSEQITPDDTTAVATDNAKTASGGKTAQKMIITTTNPIRIRVGTNPTATVGVLLVSGEIYEFTGYDFIDDARIIDDGATSAIVDIQYVLL